MTSWLLSSAALDWFPCQSSVFGLFDPSAFSLFTTSLEEGTGIGFRVASSENDWEYGVGIKKGDTVFVVMCNGVIRRKLFNK